MAETESVQKKSSSKSSSFLPPKNSLVPQEVPVSEPTQVFIPRDHSLVPSTDWLIQTSPAPELTMEEVDRQLALRSRLSNRMNGEISSIAPSSNSESVEVQAKGNIGQDGDELASITEPSVSSLSQSIEAQTAYLPKQKPEAENDILAPENEVLLAQAQLAILGLILVIVYVVGAIIVYWQRTAQDREEVIRVGVDRSRQAVADLKEQIDRVTIEIYNGIRDFFAPIRGIIDAKSAEITEFIRQKVTDIFNEQIAQPPTTTPTIPPSSQLNQTAPEPSIPEVSPVPQVAPVVSDLSVPVSPIATTLSDLERRIAQIDQEQKQLLQDVNANIERINTGITQIQEEWKQRLRDFNAKIDSINRQLDQLEAQREQERLAAETERLRQQQRELDLEIAKANIANDSHNELWRRYLADVDENEREGVIREAAAKYEAEIRESRAKYNGILPDETIDINNPNPHNVILWSDIIAQVIWDREPGNEQFGFAKPSALTPRSGVSSPGRLGGFGEGPQPQVDSDTGHKPQEILPPLGGVGAGERLEVDPNTAHEPRWLQIPERLGGFDLDPQLDVDDVSLSSGKFRGPAAKGFDWDHIMENHAPWGRVAQQRLRSNPNYIISIYENMTENQIKACVQRAWKNRNKIYTQDDDVYEQDRIEYRGYDPDTGYTLEIWQNKATGIIETAYPVKKGGM